MNSLASSRRRVHREIERERERERVRERAREREGQWGLVRRTTEEQQEAREKMIAWHSPIVLGSGSRSFRPRRRYETSSGVTRGDSRQCSRSKISHLIVRPGRREQNEWRDFLTFESEGLPSWAWPRPRDSHRVHWALGGDRSRDPRGAIGRPGDYG
jgi:hypothetical protein